MSAANCHYARGTYSPIALTKQDVRVVKIPISSQFDVGWDLQVNSTEWHFEFQAIRSVGNSDCAYLNQGEN